MIKQLSKMIIAGLMLFSVTANANAPCKTERHVFIENADAKVWNTTVCPQQSLSFHTHDYPRIAISNETGILKVFYKDGRKDEIKFIKGVPVYLSKEQGMSPHGDLNPGKEALHIMVVELRSANHK